MPLTNGSIASDLRSRSRNRISWLVRNSSGCPASDGVFSIVELPFSPWQVPQSCSFSAGGSAARVWLGRTRRTAATASRNARGRRHCLQSIIYLVFAAATLPP